MVTSLKDQASSPMPDNAVTICRKCKKQPAEFIGVYCGHLSLCGECVPPTGCVAADGVRASGWGLEILPMYDHGTTECRIDETAGEGPWRFVWLKRGFLRAENRT